MQRTYQPIEARPMPGQQTGAIAWLKANLFSSVGNSLMTVALVAVAFWALSHALDWSVFNAVFGANLEACNNLRGIGACWGVVAEKGRLIVMGRYPATAAALFGRHQEADAAPAQADPARRDPTAAALFGRHPEADAATAEADPARRDHTATAATLFGRHPEADAAAAEADPARRDPTAAAAALFGGHPQGYARGSRCVAIDLGGSGQGHPGAAARDAILREGTRWPHRPGDAGSNPRI